MNKPSKSKKLTGINEVALCLGHHLAELGFSRGAGAIQGRYYFTEFPFHPQRRFRFDYALPSLKIALEVDGGLFPYRNSRGELKPFGAHRGVKQILSDMTKLNEAAVMGWIVLRFTPQQILKGEDIPPLTRAVRMRQR